MALSKSVNKYAKLFSGACLMLAMVAGGAKASTLTSDINLRQGMICFSINNVGNEAWKIEEGAGIFWGNEKMNFTATRRDQDLLQYCKEDKPGAPLILKQTKNQEGKGVHHGIINLRYVQYYKQRTDFSWFPVICRLDIPTMEQRRYYPNRYFSIGKEVDMSQCSKVLWTKTGRGSYYKPKQ